MLTLVTGNPGNGKTLHTLQLVEAQRLAALTEKDADGNPRYPNGRAVYQHGISGLTLPWLPLENAHDWYKCPEGSIIVIDEAWRAFPVRKAGSDVPKTVEEFAVHRHKGFDVYLVTQHRHQVDTFVRKMVGRHIHLERKYGAESASVFQWERETDTTSSSQKEKALRHEWSYPKEVYAWYKSAEVHTVKKDFPWRRFWWFIPLVGSIVVLIPYAAYRLMHLGDSTREAYSGEKPGSVTGVVGRPQLYGPKSTVPSDPLLPGSAPRYASVYHVETAPVIDGCMSQLVGIVQVCRCTDQSGAVLPMSTAQCIALVKVGWFDPSRKYPDKKALDIQFLNSHQGNVAAVESGGGRGASQGAQSGTGSPADSTPPARPLP